MAWEIQEFQIQEFLYPVMFLEAVHLKKIKQKCKILAKM